jgi:hypothetical protein
VPTWYVLLETMRSPITFKTALRLAASSVALPLIFGACGDDATPEDPPVDPCEPHFTAPWTPKWHPPREPRPGSCTKAQIDSNFIACHSTSGSQTACASFRSNPAHKACNDCLFSDENEAAYGPIIWSADNSWRTNTAGCIAIVDRDLSAEGCGARVQAASACADDACDGCEPFDKFLRCREKANSTVCQTTYFDSICLLRPEHAMCTDYQSNEEYYRGAVDFFCATGPGTAPASKGGEGR